MNAELPPLDQRSELLKHPYVRIIIASRKGLGVRLSWKEVQRMALDDAVETHAMDVCNDAGYDIDGEGRLVKLENQ